MHGAFDISYGGLLLSLGFILLAGIASLRLHLGLEKDLLWGTIRTVSQLFLMGFVLRYIFAVNTWYVVLVVYFAMIFFAARIARGRAKEAQIAVFLPTFVSMSITYLIVTYIVVSVIVGMKPWYEAKYFIPLGGMVIGNSMTAISVSLERLLTDLRNRRDEVELYLVLGANYKQASAEIFRNAIKAGMIPSITNMMGVGLVFLPGMMTGQIIAGSDPLVAVKYQIMVMLMLVGSTAVGSILVAFLVRKKCFSADERLILRRT